MRAFDQELAGIVFLAALALLLLSACLATTSLIAGLCLMGVGSAMAAVGIMGMIWGR